MALGMLAFRYPSYIPSLLSMRGELFVSTFVRQNLPATSNIIKDRFYTWSTIYHSSDSTLTNWKSQPNPLWHTQCRRIINDIGHYQGLSIQNYSTNGNRQKDNKSLPADTSVSNESEPILPSDQTQKLGLVAKFKLMFKQYWYVLLPVHCVTSVAWFGGFYYLSSSGVDIPHLLQSLNFSDSIINSVKDSSMGHLAIALLCYKLAGPFRYMLTIGGSTVAIKYLSHWGYIKPMPSKERLKQIYDEKKAKFKQ